MLLFLVLICRVWITNSSKCASNEEVNVIYVMDSSGSVSDADYEVGIDFIQSSYGEGIPEGSRTSLITFSNDVDERWALYDGIDSIDKFSSKVRTRTERTQAQGTKLTRALTYSINELRYVSGKRVMVVITDGKPSSRASVCALRSTIVANEITVFVVGISSDYDTQVAQCITDSRHSFHVDDYGGLLLIEDLFNTELCIDATATAFIVFETDNPEPENLDYIEREVIPEIIAAIPNLDEVDVVINIVNHNKMTFQFPRRISNQDVRQAIEDICKQERFCNHELLLKPIAIRDHTRRALQGKYEIDVDIAFLGKEQDIPQLNDTQRFIYSDFKGDLQQYASVNLHTELEDLQFYGSVTNITLEVKGNRVYDDGSTTEEKINEVISQITPIPSNVPTTSIPTNMPTRIPSNMPTTSIPSDMPFTSLPSAAPTSIMPSAAPSITGYIALVSMSGPCSEEMTDTTIDDIASNLANIFDLDQSEIDLIVSYVVVVSLNIEDHGDNVQTTPELLEAAISDTLNVHMKDISVADDLASCNVTQTSFARAQTIHSIIMTPEFDMELNSISSLDSVVDTVNTNISIVLQATMNTDYNFTAEEFDDEVANMTFTYGLTAFTIESIFREPPSKTAEQLSLSVAMIVLFTFIIADVCFQTLFKCGKSYEFYTIRKWGLSILNLVFAIVALSIIGNSTMIKFTAVCSAILGILICVSYLYFITVHSPYFILDHITGLHGGIEDYVDDFDTEKWQIWSEKIDFAMRVLVTLRFGDSWLAASILTLCCSAISFETEPYLPFIILGYILAVWKMCQEGVILLDHLETFGIGCIILEAIVWIFCIGLAFGHGGYAMIIAIVHTCLVGFIWLLFFRRAFDKEIRTWRWDIISFVLLTSSAIVSFTLLMIFLTSVSFDSVGAQVAQLFIAFAVPFNCFMLFPVIPAMGGCPTYL